MEHYCKGNAYSLCCSTYEQSLAMVKKLKPADIEEIRALPSFRRYVESRCNPSEIISLLEDDKYFRQNLEPLLKNVYQYFNKFHCFVRLLFTMLKDLPKNFIGKQLRDVYTLCSTQSIFRTESFTDLWQLFTMLSKEDFVQTLNGAIGALNQYKETFCLDEDIGKETRRIIDKVISRTWLAGNVPLTNNLLHSGRGETNRLYEECIEQWHKNRKCKECHSDQTWQGLQGRIEKCKFPCSVDSVRCHFEKKKKF